MIIFVSGKCKPMTFATFEMSTKSVGFSIAEIAIMDHGSKLQALGEPYGGCRPVVLCIPRYQARRR
jgi:hypothetical protein